MTHATAPSLAAGGGLKPSEALRNARELITPEGAWTQQFFARNAQGKEVWYTNVQAVCFCVRGAIYRACDNDHYIADVMQDAMRTVVGVRGDLARWNDHSDRTHAEVLDAFRRAEALAIAEGR